MAKAKAPMIGYRVEEGKMVTYHVRKNRPSASTAYLIRQADKIDGMWRPTFSDRIFFTQKEAKADAVKRELGTVKSREKWLKEAKSELKKVRSIKVKD